MADTPKYVMQERADDCLSACIATIFNLRLAEVPIFCNEATADDDLRDWLTARGYSYALGKVTTDGLPRGITIGLFSGTVPHRRHAVVCKDGYIIFDPLEGPKPGIQRAFEFIIFYPLDIRACAAAMNHRENAA